MNLSSLKNISSMYLYFISIIFFIASSYAREINKLVYEFLLLLGLLFFVLGIIKRLKSK